jgi:hypothetical protein
MISKKAVLALYKKHIVQEWYKTWTVWLALAAAALPDLLQIGLDNLDLLVSASVPLLDNVNKSRLQLAMIILIPVVRALKQKKLANVDGVQGAKE